MGCPVPKIAKHNAGCSLMREPEHAQRRRRARWRKAVRIPVTVKMRAGWNEHEINAPELARAHGGCGCGGGRRARPDGGAVVLGRLRLGPDRPRRGDGVSIPVFGSGDCVEPAQLVERAASASGVGGVLVGRGALRNPWIFQQAAALGAR